MLNLFTPSRCLLALSLFFMIPGAVFAGGPSWTVEQNGGSPAFIENKGQFYTQAPEGFSSRVLYAYDGGSTRIFFTPTGVTFSFVQKSRKKKEERPKKEKFSSVEEFLEEEKEEKSAVLKSDRISYRWDGANPAAEIVAEDQAGEYFNYSYYVNGLEKNVELARGFRKLTYRNLYPNVDVVYTFHPEGGIKYALVLHPGADVNLIKMVYSGKIGLTGNGELRIPTKFGDIIDHAPLTFYQSDNAQVVASAFVKNGKCISFAVEAYDKNRTLIIDPWTQTPALPNSNKVWETETDKFGNVYIYGGDSFIRLLKYNSAGVLQWTYTSPWDSSGYWIGGFITDPNGNSFMTSGSNGEIRRISPAGAVVWSNNPNGVTTYEYWSLAFNCDQTKLYVGGTRLTFGFPVTIRGVVIEINMASGAQLNTRVVGYGSSSSFPPNIQEVSSICMGPGGNLYFLTLDTVGSINNALTTINFKRQTAYNFDYYIPAYGFGTKQPISAIRASTTAFYTANGTTLHKRDLATGVVTATATIPGGVANNGFGGTKLPANGGLDVDSCGNVYVGSTTGVHKFDANLNLLSSVSTVFAVYDVDVNYNGEVAACGWSGGTGRIQSISMSACRPLPYICVQSTLSASSTSTNVLCNGQCTGSATATAINGTAPYTYNWAPSGGTNATATGLCAGTYTCTITDNVGATATTTVTITQPATAISSSATVTNVSCNGNSTGAATVTASGGTGTLTYSWSPSGGTNATATGLAAGTYTCTITDANGCTRTQLVTITQPPAITASVNSTNVSCNGNSTGAATVTASGGTGTLTYNWSPSGGTNATATGLAAGNYTCTITDANGCTQTQTVTITQPSAISASATSTSTSCSGNTGTATITASGGTGTLTYSWAPSGGTSTTATGLSAGNYTCYVTDANGCTQTAITTVTTTNGPSVSLQSQSNVSCNGGSNGTATVNATGGNPPYTYAWSPSGGTNAAATGLSAGSYTCTVTDNSGCVQVQTVTITEPPAITGSTSSNSATCGNTNGSASVTASGGTGTLTYSWSPSGGTNATATGLGAGNYSVIVTDVNGCSQTFAVNVSSANGPNASILSQNNVLCNGDSTGDATVTVTGGTSPFTYTWSPTGGTNANAAGLSAGVYTVTVTDAAGCTSVVTITITEPAALAGNTSATSTACTANTGTATVNASGGTGPYTYSWSSGGTASTETGLGAGTYTVTVTDANGCSFMNTVSVPINAPSITTSSQNISCNGSANGSATSNITGGTGPFTYSWAPGGGTNSTASGLNAGTYTVFVTDANGCTDSASFTITEPAAIAASSTSVPACGLNNGNAAATVTSGGTAPFTFSWSPSGGTNSIATGLSAGTYTCVITDANGCTQTASVTVVTNPVPVADAGTDVTISLGNTTILSATGGGTYSWSTGETASAITVAPSATTDYCVWVTNTAGCTDSACVRVTVEVNCGELFVPNAFSPNGDGQNDVLQVYGGCIKDIRFSIYDRWGEKVFETTNPADVWDGMYKGQLMNTAVFVYRLEAVLFTGEAVSRKGNISLVR